MPTANTLVRLEHKTDKTNKYWEVRSSIAVGPQKLYLHWGRIGTKGQVKTLGPINNATAADARNRALKKLEEGYRLVYGDIANLNTLSWKTFPTITIKKGDVFSIETAFSVPEKISPLADDGSVVNAIAMTGASISYDPTPMPISPCQWAVIHKDNDKAIRGYRFPESQNYYLVMEDLSRPTSEYLYRTKKAASLLIDRGVIDSSFKIYDALLDDASSVWDSFNPARLMLYLSEQDLLARSELIGMPRLGRGVSYSSYGPYKEFPGLSPIILDVVGDGVCKAPGCLNKRNAPSLFCLESHPFMVDKKKKVLPKLKLPDPFVIRRQLDFD